MPDTKEAPKKEKPRTTFDLGTGQHGRGERVGDLVFHDLRRLAWIFGVDDDLHVREVGKGVQRCAQHGDDAAQDDEQRGHQHQGLVSPGPFDDCGEHDFFLPGKPSVARVSVGGGSARSRRPRLDRRNHPLALAALDS